MEMLSLTNEQLVLTKKALYLMLLQDIAQKYVLHRYFVLSDNIFWTKFKSLYANPILTIDYSENIDLVPKHEVQSAYFSGRQHTLHCCFIEEEGTFMYVYHLSNDTIHYVMTFEILKNIIHQYPAVISNGKLLLRSDNCSTQFKSKFVFAVI